MIKSHKIHINVKIAENTVFNSIPKNQGADNIVKSGNLKCEIDNDKEKQNCKLKPLAFIVVDTITKHVDGYLLKNSRQGETFYHSRILICTTI